MYIFGPIPSRRLGRSLGIDLLKYKTCTLNCIYCECGKTTNLIDQRKSFVPLKDVLRELDKALQNKPQIDYITFSGSGEPTLSTDIGKVICHIKKNFSEYKIALLTNGTLLKDKSLRSELIKLDLIIPSVDAISEDIFHKINCPHKGIKAKDIVAGIIEFKREFAGEIWLEVFIVPDINDNLNEIKKIKDFCFQLLPSRIQINTLDRPAPHNILLSPASYEKLVELKEFLSPLQVDIITYSKRGNDSCRDQGSKVLSNEKIINFLKRRPATTTDLAESLGIKIVEVNKILRTLEKNKIVRFKDEARGRFYYLF